MSYKVLALKWRPRNFKDVIGQDHITKSLQNAIKLNRISHAFTFTGPRGVGKTTTARILAKELNQIDNIDSSFDIIEMDAASNRGIDEIRGLRESASIASAHGKYKIYIIDEVHMLTKEAFNALLKTLEEPPEKVIFILATTDPYKIPATILSRTQRFDFRRLSEGNIVKQLKIVLESENKKYDEVCLHLIAQKADGSMRDALGYLDQMLNYCSDEIKESDIYSALGIVDENLYLKLFNLILIANTSNVIDLVNSTLDSGISVKDFILGFNKFLRTVLFRIIDKDEEFYNKLDRKNICDLDIVRFMELMMQFEAKVKFYSHPNSALEIFMIKLCKIDSVIELSDLINNIESENVNNNSSTAIARKKNDDEKAGVVAENKDKASDKKNNIDVETEINNNKNTLSKNINDSVIIKDENIQKNEEEIDSSESSDEIVQADQTANKNEKIEVDVTVNESLPESQELENLDFDKISTSYQTILSIIEKKNSKTANFLENSLVCKVEGKSVYIKVDKVNNFVFNTLLNDKEIIENTINDILKVECSVVLERGKIEDSDKNIKTKKIEDDKEHPLFMDALNKFEGQIIK